MLVVAERYEEKLRKSNKGVGCQGVERLPPAYYSNLQSPLARKSFPTNQIPVVG